MYSILQTTCKVKIEVKVFETQSEGSKCEIK